MRAEVARYIEAHQEQAVEELLRLCRQPSVSAQRLGVEECARLLRDLMEGAGLEARVLPSPVEGHPVVYAQRRGRSERTLLFYNHYDVQPPDPLEEWQTPPFEPTVRDGAVYGRGVSDDKGHLASRLAAVRAFLATEGELPCTVKFIVEGAEEIGSPGLPEFVAEHRELLRADACLWEGGGVNWRGQPQVYLGCKGIQYVELVCRVANRDSHSSYGTVVPNPAWRLAWALSTLKDRDERVLIPGFYDAVRPPTEAELAALEALPHEDEELRRSLGLRGFVLGLRGREWLRRHIFEPTCSICGIGGGYQGPGTKTIIPAEARAKVDFRLVPDQDPEDVVAKLRAHLEAQGFGDIEVIVEHGEPPARTPIDHPWVRLVRETAREVYGQEAVVLPSTAGTGPMHVFAGAPLHLPVASAGVDYPDNRMHAPNENVRLDYFLQGTLHVAAIMARFGERGV